MARNFKLGFKISADGGDTAAREVAQMEQALRAVREENAQVARTAARLKDAYNLNDAEVKQVQAAMKQLAAETAKAEAEAANLDAGLTAIAGSSAALGAAITAAFAKGLQAFAQFEQYEAVLETALGSPEAARAALSGIEDFATQTPFQLNEVVEAFIKLQNRGIKPTNEVLTQLGDLASSQGKTLDQITEAVLDAQTGEFERLKEFGIRASAAGDQVTFAFKGIEQTVPKTEAAIAEFLFSLGDLEGIAGGMARQSETLAGRFSNLQDEATKTGRVFGEFAAIGARPVVEAGIALLQTFNALPGPIQATLLASTAFTGVLAAAVAAIIAYNLANGQRVVQDVLAVAGTIKNTAATTANTAVTTANAAAKALLATVTGQATAAQLAQTKALAAGAVTLGAFAGAAASVGLVVDTFAKTTAAAGDTREAIASVDKALATLQDSGRAAGDGLSAAVGTEAEQNLEQLRQGLGGVQNFLDNFIRGPIPGLATATEAATSRATVAFRDLVTSTDDVKLAAAGVAVALEKGLAVDPSEIEATTAAIDASIAALEAQRPVSEQDIQVRDAQIASLQAYRDRITATTEGTVALGDATGGLTDKIKDLGDALKDSLGAIDLAKVQQQAKILEQLARGEITQPEADSRLANLEAASLEDRLNAQRTFLNELRTLRAAATDDSEQALELDRQILQAETALNQTRVQLARNTVDENKKAEEETTRAAETAAKDRQRIAEDEAKKRTESIKQVADERKRLEKEAFDAEQRQATRANSDATDARREARDRQRRDADRALQRQLQADDKAYQAQRREQDKAAQRERQESDKAFQVSQQAQARTFQASQQAAADAFQKRQQAERDRAGREFDVLTSEVERRIQLQQAADAQSRRELREQFREEDRQLKQRRQVEKEVLRDRASVLSRRSEETQLSPLEQARADFEAKLQEQAAQFQKAQQAEAEAFQLQQQADADARRQQQQAEDDARAEARAAEDEARRQRLADEADARADARAAEDKAFADQERQIQDAFAEQQRQAERAFNEQQRQADLATARQVAAILAAARPAAVAGARRDGGPVTAGQTYLVGEAGPELIVPRRSGYVLTAKETAALERNLSVGSPNISLASSTGGVEARLEALLKAVQKAGKRPISAPQENHFYNEPDPYGAAAGLRLAELRQRIRGGAL